MHESLSSLMQLHGVVNSSEMMGSMSRVWGAVIVRVVPLVSLQGAACPR